MSNSSEISDFTCSQQRCQVQGRFHATRQLRKLTWLDIGSFIVLQDRVSAQILYQKKVVKPFCEAVTRLELNGIERAMYTTLARLSDTPENLTSSSQTSHPFGMDSTDRGLASSSAATAFPVMGTGREENCQHSTSS